MANPGDDINRDNPYINGPYAPIAEESTCSELSVVGEIPKDLCGVYLRNGPNPKHRPRGRYHWFDGDGMIHALHFEDGRAHYRNRWVRTAHLADEDAAGRALWSGLMDSTAKNPEHAPYKDTANTDITGFAGEALATWYICGLPYRVDPLTLETRGVHTFGAERPRRISAHTKVDAETGELMFFSYGMAPHLTYGVVDERGRLVHSTRIPLPGPRLPHDMAITENHSILMDLPVFFTDKAIEQRRWRVDYHPELPARFAVLPRRGDADSVRWFESSPCYIYHTVNAWEEDNAIVMIACKTDEPLPRPDFARDGAWAPMMATLRLSASLWRWRFDLETGECREEKLDDRSTEFPSVNLGHLGRPSRYNYNVSLADTPTLIFDGVVKYDTHTGAVQHHALGPGQFASESPFAPRHGRRGRPGEGAEDDGYLLTFVRDQVEDRSEVWILDASDVSAPPIGRIHIPRRVPNGFHACWIPGNDLIGDT